MQRHFLRWTVLCFSVFGLLACATRADQPAGKSASKSYLRMERDDKGEPLSLQSAVVRFTQDKGKYEGSAVDLVSAVHVADKEYYDQLNKLLAEYDAVLYELVAPEGTRVPRGGPRGSTSPVTGLQTGMTGLLELDFQLAEIDYGADNMVHADMSPEQFRNSMRRRGETVTTMFMRMFGYALAKQSQNSSNNTDAKLLLAFLDPNRAMALKRVLAEQFEQMDGMLAFFDGPDGSTIITERNGVALDVLRKQLDEGKRKIAIFYGAGHMADFERRLKADFGMDRADIRWLTAWDLTDGSSED